MTNEKQTISNLRKLKSFHNGSYGADIDRAIKALEQEPKTNNRVKTELNRVKAELKPCEDCISRQAVLDRIDRYIEKAQSTGIKDDFISFEELVIKELPSVNPQEQKTGHWIEDENEMKVRCSECGEENDECSKYCPNCGAKMEE